LEKFLAAKVLEVRVLHPALAQNLVGKGQELKRHNFSGRRGLMSACGTDGRVLASF
jgi:hypothetical protein